MRVNLNIVFIVTDMRILRKMRDNVVMKDNLGIILEGVRREAGVTQKCIANGIISINYMCKLERGEKELDYLVMETLFERLGKCADKVEKGITNDDYQLIRLRDEIADCISKNNPTCARVKLKEYTTWANMKNNVHKQYLFLIKALIEYLEKRDAHTCMLQLMETLEITHSKWNENGSMYLCNQEVRIILLIAYMKIEVGEWKEAEDKLIKGCSFLLQHYTDGEELVKVYPHMLWLLAKVLFLQKKVQESFMTIQKAKECLSENGSLMPMYALLELESKCLKILNRQELLQENVQNRDAFVFLYEMAEEKMPVEEVGQLLLCSHQREYIILNYLVKEVREGKGITQEQLCEGICEQESLSRIESGKRNPHRKVLYQLLKKLDINREQYYGFIFANDFTIYERVRDYRRCGPKNEKEKQINLFQEIEKMLDLRIAVNRQFVEMERLYLENRLHGEEKINVLKNLLYVTMPKIEGKELLYRIPFRAEYSILNRIAITYREQNMLEEALHIYKMIQDEYKYSQVEMAYHAVPGLTFFLNYSGFLEDNNELIKALQVSNEGLQFAISICRGDIIGNILVNRSCIYDKTQESVLEEKCLRYGYIFIKMYKRNKIKEKVEKIYREKYKCSL